MWGAIAEFRNFRADKKITVHGEASSAAAYFLLFANNSQAIQQSTFVYHRASHIFEALGIELDEPLRLRLEKINSDLRAATEEKLNIEVFLEIASSQNGFDVTMDRFFDINEPPIDVLLDSEQALEVGLIKKVLTLTANEADILNMSLISASNKKEVRLINSEKFKSNNEMTLSELKEKHPDIYAQAISEVTVEEDGSRNGKVDDVKISAIRKEAKEQERQRVDSWMAWNEIAPEKVSEGIKSGKDITAVDTQELTILALKKDHMKSVDTANQGVDVDGSVDDVDENTELKQYEANVNKILDATIRNY